MARTKRTKLEKRISRYAYFIFGVGLWIILVCTSYQKNRLGFGLELLEGVPKLPEDALTRIPTRNNKVVLFGPHDRYNFGDLLFAKVLEKLLLSQASYSPDEILYGGIVSVDMSSHGGSPNILSMKKIQALSQNDEFFGPYDMIYTGGESLSCSSACATGMMPTKELAAQAQRESLSECGYLIPKRLLLKDPETTEKPLNYAVANSLGGSGSIASYCKEAIETADYVAYRDASPLYPDSAVMTRELFEKEIEEGANAVWNDLGQPKKYVAVQYRKLEGGDEEAQQIAQALDVVAKGANAKIVFFPAGLVPRHDSYESYELVKSLMTEEAIVYKTENIWKTIGLISRAHAVISTSLHVRIMAFIYLKPRVTWSLNKSKLVLFIQYWDAPTSAPVIDFAQVNQTWAVTKKHYFENPEESRRQNQVKYKEAVKKYLESFENISKLLRPQLVTLPPAKLSGNRTK